MARRWPKDVSTAAAAEEKEKRRAAKNDSILEMREGDQVRSRLVSFFRPAAQRKF